MNVNVLPVSNITLNLLLASLIPILPVKNVLKWFNNGISCFLSIKFLIGDPFYEAD
jgi:hypothetical protein